MLIHDYQVRRRTREDLEREASRLRREWGLGPEDQIKVFDLLFANMPEKLKQLGLKMVERSPGFMGEREAYAAPKSKRIFYRASLLARLKMGIVEASIIFLHELAHVLLHPVGEKAWLISGNETPAYISDEEISSEWQATGLAVALKAPKAAAIQCTSATQIAQRFGLSEEHANSRFETLSRQRKRELPASYKRFKNEAFKKAEATLPISDGSYLLEQCSYCGRKLLHQTGCKYLCDGCGRYSDQFQDGDLVDFEPW